MVIESLAATATIFLLVVVVTQVAFAVVARDATEAAVSAASRRAGRPGADFGVESARLVAELSRVVAGAVDANAIVESDGSNVRVQAGFRWVPPGPDLIPITIRASSVSPLVVPP